MTLLPSVEEARFGRALKLVGRLDVELLPGGAVVLRYYRRGNGEYREVRGASIHEALDRLFRRFNSQAPE